MMPEIGAKTCKGRGRLPVFVKITAGDGGEEMEFGRFVGLVGKGRECCGGGEHSFHKTIEVASEHSLSPGWIIEFLMEIGARCDCQIAYLNLKNDWLWRQWEFRVQGVRNRVNGRSFEVCPKGTDHGFERSVRLEVQNEVS